MRGRLRRGRPGHRQQFRRRDWQWQWRARHRWHERWHRQHARFKHSLGARLTLVFLLLAAACSLLLWAGLRSAHGLWWALPLLLIGTGLAYAAVRHMLRPLRALELGAAAFGRGELDHRVAVRQRDEIGDLALRFNAMATDIQAMLDGKRALLLAISHELRSPLTRARLHAELLDEGAAKQPLLDELAQMRELISSLLETERLGAGHAALQLQALDLAQLARELAPAEVALDIEPGLPPLQLDRPRLQLLLRNVLANALRHNDAARGPVVLSLRREGQGLRAGQRLTVRDHGPGVPEAALAQLGQPFYRPDSARSRQDGGVGLGLCLCKLVAQAHGSALQLRNARPGLEVSVLLPAV